MVSIGQSATSTATPVAATMESAGLGLVDGVSQQQCSCQYGKLSGWSSSSGRQVQ